MCKPWKPRPWCLWWELSRIPCSVRILYIVITWFNKWVLSTHISVKILNKVEQSVWKKLEVCVNIKTWLGCQWPNWVWLSPAEPWTRRCWIGPGLEFDNCPPANCRQHTPCKWKQSCWRAGAYVTKQLTRQTCSRPQSRESKDFSKTSRGTIK